MDTPTKSAFEIKRDLIERTLTDEEINNLLEDYAEVDDITEIEIDTHIRYFTITFENNKATKVFRLGGKVFSISPDRDYVMLKHGNNMIQAPVQNTIFYKQLTIAEIKKEYELILNTYEDEIMELKAENKNLYEKLTGTDGRMKSRRHDREKRYKEDDFSTSDPDTKKSVKRSMMSTQKISNGPPKSKIEYNKQVRL